jgi:hypothetical protein
MVFLGPPGGEIEVRLVKPPFDAVDSARIYFDEYMELGTPHSLELNKLALRYVVPEDTTYAIEITLRKGYRLGKYTGIRINIYDKARDVLLGKKNFFLPGLKKPTDADKKLLVSSLESSGLEGMRRTDAQLNFCGLSAGRPPGLWVSKHC